MTTDVEDREQALAAEVVRRNVLDATGRAAQCLLGANAGLHRLTRLQFNRFQQAIRALDQLEQALKFGR